MIRYQRAIVDNLGKVALRYTIDTSQHLVTITGEYSGPAAWEALLTRILNDPERKPGFAYLRDLRGAMTPVDAATVVSVIEVVRSFWSRLEPSRFAVLSSRERESVAFVAHAVADAQGIPLQTFDSYEEAMSWLKESARPSITQ